MARKTLAELAKIQDQNPNDRFGYVSGDPSFKFQDVRRYNAEKTWIDSRMFLNDTFTVRVDEKALVCARCGGMIRPGGTAVAHSVREVDGKPVRDFSHPACWSTAELADHRGRQPSGWEGLKNDPAIGTQWWYRNMKKALDAPGFTVDVSPVENAEVGALASLERSMSAADFNRYKKCLEARHWLNQQLNGTNQ